QFQITGSLHVETKYYSAGSSRIAYRIDGEITWLLIDHLGSTVGTVNADGDLISVLKYTTYGELRSGNSTTDYKYTGQREEVEIGLYYYVARFYDPAIGRFISADSLIPDPGSSQGFDRYAYVDNSPVNYNDPSGHMVDDGCTTEGCSYSDYEYMQDVQKNQLLEIQASQRSCQSGVDTYCSSVEAVLMHYPKLVTGVSISYSGQAGYGAEAGGQYEKSFIMDWSEGNLYITDNAGAFVYGGTPTGLGGEFQATLFVLHGIPHDLKDISDKLRGNQVFGSPELGLDSIIGASASGLLSVDIDQDGNPIYKQGSGYQYSSGLSFSLTGNEIPNGIEAGLKLGWVSNISVKRIPLR
ncbi:MAG TPA: RHS repeat-associated core domain-containing protein, partial [Candidatus Cloacimonadota bacterium]|nr:RHS repeat-associated core domain-containing protein [Candidatus Cloacimonadota bacterium]